MLYQFAGQRNKRRFKFSSTELYAKGNYQFGIIISKAK